MKTATEQAQQAPAPTYQVLSGGTIEGCFNVEYSDIASKGEARAIALKNQEEHGGLWIIATVWPKGS